ncbi:MAG: ribosome assembly factor SBDS [archaeon]|nr:ribosome assembly factor SBDS [archaeon]
MVQLEDAVIARLSKSGTRFEVLVDPDLALQVRRGQTVSNHDLLAVEKIFVDARAGDEATESDLQHAFGTKDAREIALKIVKDGEVQLTTEQRKHLREEKRRQIIAFIAQNAFNPQTNTPHPPLRIEHALEEAKVHVDEFKDVTSQVNDIIPKLRQILPISMEKITVGVKVPPQYAGAALNVLHSYGLKQQEWQSDGSLVALVEIPGGMKQELFDRLNHATKGEVVTKLIQK